MITDGVIGVIWRSLLVLIMLLHLVSCEYYISTIAGTGNSTYGGDGGDATSATFYYPYGVAVDSSGII